MANFGIEMFPLGLLNVEMTDAMFRFATHFKVTLEVELLQEEFLLVRLLV